MSISSKHQICGLLIGTAVGDAMGLPAEGLSRARIQRLYSGECHHRFFFGTGMVSDDTEHTLFVAQALLKFNNDADAFARCLAWKFRWWLLSVPAGIGFATLRAILKLWMGVQPASSGVHSAGNGPAMRSAIIGAVFADQAHELESFVRACTRLTHTDGRALTGALAIANAAAWITQPHRGDPMNTKALLATLRQLSIDTEWQMAINKLETSLAESDSVIEFAATLGCQKRVTGYVFHTVRIALFAWLRHWGDFPAAVSAVIECGGDTDTVAAITGALAGCTTGREGIPAAWVMGICDWPRSVKLLGTISARLSGAEVRAPVRYFWPAIIPRNFFFLLVVLFHGFRRLLPPY